MTAARIPCINPACRRTASSERLGDCRYIVCQKCWKVLPVATRKRFRKLHAVSRRLDRLYAKPKFCEGRGAQWSRIDRLYNAAWARMDYYLACFFSSESGPDGLEDFMKENGIA